MRQLKDFIDILDGRASMYTMSRTYGEVCAFLDGFDACSELEVMRGFRSWLASRGNGRMELTWWSLVLSEMNGGISVLDAQKFSADENDQAISLLFRLLSEFLEYRSLNDGRML